MSDPIRRSLVSDQVFRLICDQILTGAYAPGEKLPTQRALAAELDVNMASVREAVKRLEQLGLVEVRQGDAMRVRDWRAGGRPRRDRARAVSRRAGSTAPRSPACSRRAG